jgi:dihydropteroate synthase
MNINCNGNLIDLSTPKVMGILNVTPNSFYDGGKHKEINSIIHQVNKMLSEGADFIDIGAYSSKPSAEFVSEEEEIKRLVPIVKSLVETFPNIVLSVDTFRAQVAKASVENGVAMVNDIAAGLLDDKMLSSIT